MEGSTEQSQEQNNQDDSDEPGGPAARRRGARTRSLASRAKAKRKKRMCPKAARKASPRNARRRSTSPVGRKARASRNTPPRRPNTSVLDDPGGFRLSRLHAPVRRGRGRGNLVRRRRAGAAAQPSSTSSFRSCTSRSAGSRTGCSAACSRSKTAPGSSISKKACSTPRGFPASSPIRFSRYPSRGSAKRPSATRW